ncbi:MAG: DUF4416 family protein [Phycisphaerae bacterium]
MGSIRPPKPAKLFCGLLSADLDLMAEASRRLAKQFGPIDATSETWPFTATDYYQHEMGSDIKRRFVTFAQLISVDRLPEIKRFTNDLEKGFCHDLALALDTRPINIDPGYLNLSKLVLATTKDYSHRLYLARGIYAEVTLHYENAAWQPWPWTYPDYASQDYRDFFNQVRQVYKDAL